MSKIDQIENALRTAFIIKGTALEKFNIMDRMHHHQVPGVSIAVIDEGKVDCAKGYGLRNYNKQEPVTIDTLFQAASISKPITALGALLLVEKGILDLDIPVNEYLKRWRAEELIDWVIPDNNFTKDTPVTLRLLLSHNAGLTVHGFPGYSKDQSLPTTEQILRGVKPLVNTDPVIVDVIPGSSTRYSGGGYTVVQLLIEQIAKDQGSSFAEWMKVNVLDKLEMHNSTFQQPLLYELYNSAATGHSEEYFAIPGEWHVYPEMAAAGLWTTPSDLAKAIISIQNSFNGTDFKILSHAMICQMLTQQNGSFGLGPEITSDKETLAFEHNGTNKGFRACWYGLVNESKGVVVMTNSDTRSQLIREIIAAVADVYKWPTLQPDEITLCDKTPDNYHLFAGKYLTPGKEEPIEIIVENNKLLVKFAEKMASKELFQHDDSTFFILEGFVQKMSFNFVHNIKQANTFTLSDVHGKGLVFCTRV